MATDKVFRVLFLSRRGTARGVMAEVLLNRLGNGRFVGYSAGVEPAKSIEPEALELLKVSGFDTTGLTPRHFAEFAKANAEPLDLVFTLSDTAAGEPMPDWPGLPVTAHWSYPDPVRTTGADWERKQAFSRVMKQLERRIAAFVNLRPEALDRMSLKAHVEALARADDSPKV